MLGIVRLYHDSYGNNMGSKTFCQLSKYFGGVLITDNKKIKQLKEFPQISHQDAIKNIKKFTRLMVYNSKPNMFGGVAPKHTAEVVRLILAAPEVYFYNCDPILDLQQSVPTSHEKEVPGLTRAINRMLYQSIRLDRTNTDLTLFLAAQIDKPIISIKDGPKKYWSACYFGNSRQKYRQDQVFELLNPLPTRLIIGHEHEHFAWFDYTPNFYETLSTAWVTPIIGDKKMHYETGIPSVRLYETWHTTTVGLLDSRFKVDGLDSRFYFDNPQDFQNKCLFIKNNPALYQQMIGIQQGLLKKLKKKYKNAKYDWKAIRKEKEKKKAIEQKQEEAIKLIKVNKAKNRLIESNIIKPRKNEQ